MAAALCVAAIVVWLLAADQLSGAAATAVIFVCWGGLVGAGWLSAWSLLFVAVAPVLGELSDRAGWQGREGDITNLGAGLLIVAPVAVVLIFVGVAARVGRQSYRQRNSKARSGG
jgi:hypothetical protein